MAVTRKTIRTVSLAVGIPVVFIALCIVGLIFAFGGFRDNIAKVALSPVTKAIEAKGATLLCDQGDAGYGPDNSQPWYQAFYRVPNNAPARKALFAAEVAIGYPLKPDPAVSDQSARDRFYASEISDAQLGTTLSIFRNTKVTLDCPSNWNQVVHTSGTGAIYQIGFTSPQR